MSLADLRREYAGRPLSRKDLHPDPLKQFQLWFQEALDTEVPDANAMTLATVSSHGLPSARIMLLKAAEARGLVFYTNYASRKSRELANNPSAAMVFYWPQISRQVRVTGTTERLSAQESEEYFHTRPRDSQLAALASHQSSPLGSRRELEEKMAELSRRYEGKGVPLPETWGGYCLSPATYEFWQGRPSRLHDRFLYRLEAGEWKIQRLNP